MPETTQFPGANDSGYEGGHLRPNTILLARYKIDAKLGGGGQGAVYQARDLNFPDARRLVAIKEMTVMTADPSLRASSLKTFQREANILATLNHPATPKIYDFFDQNNSAYLIMEYINGNNLEEILIKTKKIPIDKIVEWAIELCDVLQYLHSYQPEPIIFRDMKPANIMIDSLGKVRLVDFGIAKIFVSGVKHTTIGTEGYSSPEQYKGNANPLSDIFSLGATLHHVITRKDPRLEPPFSFSERNIMDYNEEATPELAAILDKALSFEPEKRYQSCAEMKEAFMALRYRPIGTSVASAATNGSAPTPRANSRELVDSGADGRMQPIWTFETEDEIRSSPASADGVVFVGSYDTNLWAIEQQSGEFIWKRPSDAGIASTPGIDSYHGQVIIGSEDYTIRAINMRDGRVNWSHITGNKVRSSPNIAHGYVFFGSDDGKLYALLADNGRYQWEYDAGSAVRSKPFITNERVIFGTEGGDIVGLELNGQRKWVLRTKKAVTSSPYVDLEGICYVGSFDGFIYAIDADSGFSHWRVRTTGPIISSPTVHRNLVYIGSADGRLYCINTQTGKERWTYQTEKPIVASPIVHDGVVYIGGTDRIFHAIDAMNGKEIWRFETKGAITSAAHIVDDLILFGSLDHTLYALPLVRQ
ncbi:serine/threonine-protein kinase [Phototrophicus methaneseepsis]|uniref:non-specific serine/threonine protein kinase n=1 Tax=Phototrophicus methaneseepsis TaxID=2710758 RepID=A0A7S8E6B1_9CHLR|nr:serine/threonine-protein kinase [Phototrophicus methaneseepsis]QPC81182.1 serine/threonine-protein kinase [Phototrophicus methaneseepsis]